MMSPLCQLNEVAVGNAVLASWQGRQLIVFREAADLVHVYLNRCPHLGIPLTWQPTQLWDKPQRHLQCATHGALFIPATGACISGPCKGDSLWSVSASISDGAVLIDAAELPKTVQQP
jgi:nitrite reductase/ring-hydroxylating ferredoxin subunit